MRKFVVIIIANFFIATSFLALPGISTSNYQNNSDRKEMNLSNTFSISGKPPSPPVIWTENFYNFYIPVPQDSENDQIYYFLDWGDGTNTGWIGPYNPGVTVNITHAWDQEGSYKIKAKAKDQEGESKCAVYSLGLSSDLNFFGIEIGFAGLTYTFTIYWKGCSGDYFLFIDWGDGTNTDWFGPYNEQPVLFSHKWSAPGKYVLRLRFKDIFGNYSQWISFTITILSINNNGPNRPSITGPIRVKPGSYEYTFNSTDPDGDDIKYYIDWGDGNTSGWTDPYHSGELVILNHTFLKIRIYLIRVKAMDPYNYESEWGHQEVVIPKSTSQLINPSLLQVIKRLLTQIIRI